MLCQNLAELLKSPQSDENRADISCAAREHGKYRWRQGYRLEEVIREASILRRIISHNWLDAYARKVPKLDGRSRRAAENIIHQAMDDIIIDSAEQFVDEQQTTTSDLNSQLADSLAELRQQKAAADAANPAKDSFLAMLSHASGQTKKYCRAGKCPLFCLAVKRSVFCSYPDRGVSTTVVNRCSKSTRERHPSGLYRIIFPGKRG